MGGDFRGTGRTDLLDLIGAISSINKLAAGSPIALSLSFDAIPLPTAGRTLTVNLAVPAQAGDSIALMSSDPAVHVPASVALTAGAVQQSVSYSIASGFDTHHMLDITASLNGATAHAFGSHANANLTPSVQATILHGIVGHTGPVAVAAGGSVVLVFHLASQGGYGGNFAGLTCSGLPAGTSCTFVASELSLSPDGSVETAFAITTSPNTSLGSYPLQITTSNGVVTVSATVVFGVGDFSISTTPEALPTNNGVDPPYTTVTATYLYGYDASLNISCSGLPQGAQCYSAGDIFPGSGGAQVSASVTGLAPADYPFTITATPAGGGPSHSITALLRVEGFTASLAQRALTAQTGKPVNATVTFRSVNHFKTSSLQVGCQSTPSVTCTMTPYAAALNDGGTATVQVAITGTYSAGAGGAAPQQALADPLAVVGSPAAAPRGGAGTERYAAVPVPRWHLYLVERVWRRAVFVTAAGKQPNDQSAALRDDHPDGRRSERTAEHRNDDADCD